MAMTDAVSVGSLFQGELMVSKCAPAAKTDNTKTFDQFLNGKSTTQKQSADTDTFRNTKVSGTEGKEQPVSYERQEAVSAAKDTAGQETEPAGTGKLSKEETEALVQEVRNILKEGLSVDDVAIDEALQALGITLADLFQPEVLQQFVLFVHGGEESTDFLLDEGMLQGFLDVMQDFRLFADTNAEQMPALLEVLDQPVVLDEFLQQQGLSPKEAQAFMAEMEAAVHTEGQTADPGRMEGQTMVSDGAAQQTAVPQQQTAVPEAMAQQTATEEPVTVVAAGMQEETVRPDMQKTAGLADSQGDAYVLTDAKQIAENLSVQNEGNSGQESGTEENLGGDSSNLLFSQDNKVPEARQDAMPLFTNQLQQAQQDVPVMKPEMNGMLRMQQMVDIVNQVSGQIRSLVSANTTSMEMQLYPEHLGKVLLSVVSKEGIMTANFQVETEDAKHALESQMLLLREDLEAKNLKVDSVEVQVSDFSFGQSSEAEKQGQNDPSNRQNKRKFRYDMEEDGVSAAEKEASAEQVRRQVMRDSGSSIDFTA